MFGMRVDIMLMASLYDMWVGMMLLVLMSMFSMYVLMLTNRCRMLMCVLVGSCWMEVVFDGFESS